MNLLKRKKDFKECSEIWLGSQRYSVKESTLSHYYDIVENHLIPRFGEVPIDKFEAKDLINFNNYLLEHGNKKNDGGLSPKTVRDIDVILHQILKFHGVDIRVKGPKIAKKAIAILDKSEQRKIESYVSAHLNSYNAGIIISLNTGLRIGEVCALKWEDVDFDENVIYVRKTILRVKDINNPNKSKVIIDRPKTDAAVRWVPINRKLEYVLRKIKSKPSHYILTDSPKFIDPRNYYDRYRTILKKLDIDNYNYHILRHTFATRCIEVGADSTSLSEMLGHISIKTTLSLYVHPTVESKRKFLDKICDL